MIAADRLANLYSATIPAWRPSYEHFEPNQTAFPVKFGGKTKIMTAGEVTVRPDASCER